MAVWKVSPSVDWKVVSRAEKLVADLVSWWAVLMAETRVAE